MLALMKKNRSIDYEGLIHEAALWGAWQGAGSQLTTSAQRAHKALFPGLEYPHGNTKSRAQALLGEDKFVRGNR
jgi:hypothetical protein